VGVAILACSFGIAVWVGWCFKKHEFPVVWWVASASLRSLMAANLMFYFCFLVV